MSQLREARKSFVYSDIQTEFELPLLSDLIGVKYRYKGRDPDIGLDCLGLVIVAAKRLFGITMHELVDYPEDWAVQGLNFYGEHWDEVFDRSEVIVPGTVLLFQFGSPVPNHIGIYAGQDRIIHAYQDFNISYGKVPRYAKYVKMAGRPLKKQPSQLQAQEAVR